MGTSLSGQPLNSLTLLCLIEASRNLEKLYGFDMVSLSLFLMSPIYGRRHRVGGERWSVHG